MTIDSFIANATDGGCGYALPFGLSAGAHTAGAPVALTWHPNVAQRAKHRVRQRRCARAAARERHDDEAMIGVPAASVGHAQSSRQLLEPVTGSGVVALKRFRFG